MPCYIDGAEAAQVRGDKNCCVGDFTCEKCDKMSRVDFIHPVEPGSIVTCPRCGHKQGFAGNDWRQSPFFNSASDSDSGVP